MRVVDVLVVATATFGEVWARRLDALRRALYQLDQFAVGVAFFAFCQLNFGGFAGGRTKGGTKTARPSGRRPIQSPP